MPKLPASKERSGLGAGLRLRFGASAIAIFTPAEAKADDTILRRAKTYRNGRLRVNATAVWSGGLDKLR